MSEIIKINDWTLVKNEDKPEPLVQDLELAGKLGYASPVTIKKLIKRMVDAGQLGVVSTVGNGEVGGRAGLNYFLDERQALKIIARSKTDTADKILDEVIAVYLAYRKGLLPTSPANSSDVQAMALQKLSEAVQEKQEWAIRLALSLTTKHSPRPVPSAPVIAQLPEKPPAETPWEIDARVARFVERFLQTDTGRSVRAYDIHWRFNNGEWPRRPVSLMDFSVSLSRVLPGRVCQHGGYDIITDASIKGGAR